MAQYSFLLEADSDNEVIGFHATFTSEGPVLVIFSRQARLDEFLDLLSPILAKEGKKIAYSSHEADSIEEIVGSITQSDPTMQDALFVPDDAPIVDSILEYYAQVDS
jgi:hypothetical protein